MTLLWQLERVRKTLAAIYGWKSGIPDLVERTGRHHKLDGPNARCVGG